MAKKHSLKFWVIFWTVSVLFLAGWFVFWEVKNRNLRFLGYVADLAPVSEETKGDLQALISLANYVLQTNGEERVFLVLFQNDMEIRPGGGFIGSFGILRIKDGHVADFAVHDTINFDGRVPTTVPPPYPMAQTLRIGSLQLRDSNYSPDFSENAKQAEYFYHLGQGREQFDGVVAITTNVLESFLEVTGPIEVSGYPGRYTAENAVLDLEDQVERKFVEQGIERGDRKSVMNLLGHEILAKVKALSLEEKYQLFQVVLEDLHRKDIQLSFKDENLQARVEAAGWDGKVDTFWTDDYVLLVDANLGALKSDHYIKRSLEYSVDLSQAVPRAKLAITYQHTATEKSWLTKDYLTYARVYVPKGSWLARYEGNASEPKFGEELGKKYFGMLVDVPLGSTKTVVLEYDLPKSIPRDYYDLKIQKQAGVNDVPVKTHIVFANGIREDREFVLNSDWMLSEQE
jgi:hypothetical protein